MIKRREVGNRAVIYFDSIDLDILEFLNKSNSKNPMGAWEVLELADKLKINHKSLKPHLDKLINLGLIQIISMYYYPPSNKKRKEKISGLTTVEEEKKFLRSINYYSETTENNKKIEFFRNVLKVLQKVRELYKENQTKKRIKTDLRSKKIIEYYGKKIPLRITEKRLEKLLKK